MSRRSKIQSLSGARAVLTPRGTERARNGHLWIYRSDVVEVTDSASGDVVRVVDHRGNFLALAHFGAESEIVLRLLSFSEAAVDRDFWKARLHAAKAWRERVVAGSEAYRLVHSEGDLLPGLIVDRYGDAFAIQTLTPGMDALKEMWVELLVEEFHPRIIVERNDAKVRGLEGLPLTSGVLYSASGGETAETAEARMTENGLQFSIDLLGGQKTGAFLDQRENRAVAGTYARGRALDCFTFQGSFALHMARRCDQVTAIDISAPAIERAKQNAALNDIDNIDFKEGNVFDELHRFDDSGDRFDTIVLDPPAFAKNRRAVEAALRGYKEINLRALKLLAPGGVLITCSCSYHVNEEAFLAVLSEAAADARRRVQVVEKRTQSRDHPILLTMPETRYLKCIVLHPMD
jgi:23S rRNA (cytosine1962-C5)-methyltransferase